MAARRLGHGSLSTWSLSLTVFTPREKDYQTYHTQDELYFIMQGRGEFVVEAQRYPFESGDALFVPAYKKHRFENFSEDLVTWAVFWGPQGGESNS